jgi:cytoskeletal protein CcmA (bactofilin family)
MKCVAKLMSRFRKQHRPSQPAKLKITSIAVGDEVHGDICASGDLRVDGMICGEIDVHHRLEIGESGLIEGSEAKAGDMMVKGTVKVDQIRVVNALIVTSKAYLEGQVIAGSIYIESGCTVRGSMRTLTPMMNHPYPPVVGGLVSPPEMDSRP